MQILQDDELEFCKAFQSLHRVHNIGGLFVFQCISNLRFKCHSFIQKMSFQAKNYEARTSEDII